MRMPFQRFSPAVPLLVLAVLALALGACTRESDENTNEGVDASGAAVALEVEITDESIEMPESVGAGTVVFEVSNTGTSEHGFAIEGVGEQLPSLGVDELDALQLELEPGTYVVFSPVEGDREAGLERELTVTEASATSGSDPADDGVGPSERQDEMDDEDAAP
jgi:hypothetical protein